MSMLGRIWVDEKKVWTFGRLDCCNDCVPVFPEALVDMTFGDGGLGCSLRELKFENRLCVNTARNRFEVFLLYSG